MKKMLAILFALSMMWSASFVLAEDLGVQIIGSDAAAAIPMSLDDMQLGTSYTLDGYAIVLPKEMKMVDCFAQFGENEDYSVYRTGSLNYEETSYLPVYCHSQSAFKETSWRYVDAVWMDSGNSAEFLWPLMDVTNLQKSGVEFTEEATIKVLYQDDYEFNGWIRQIVYDHMEAQYGDKGLSRYGYEKEAYPNEIVMNPVKVEVIDMMYTGTYAFGCTLPNYVIEDKMAPLRIEIQLGENDLTYHIRK